jgi:predicted  nucleic acid-binding Zn-ribbon protein
MNILACVEPLRRLEGLGREMTQPSWHARPTDEREEKETEFVRLQEQLPSAVLMLLRGKISTGSRLAAYSRRAKCTACYMSLPRGDYGAVLAGRRPVLCQHCGVLLFADEEERANAAVAKTQ